MTQQYFFRWHHQSGNTVATNAARLGVCKTTYFNYMSGRNPISRTVYLATLALDAGLDKKMEKQHASYL